MYILYKRGKDIFLILYLKLSSSNQNVLLVARVHPIGNSEPRFSISSTCPSCATNRKPRLLGVSATNRKAIGKMFY